MLKKLFVAAVAAAAMSIPFGGLGLFAGAGTAAAGSWPADPTWPTDPTWPAPLDWGSYPAGSSNPGHSPFVGWPMGG